MLINFMILIILVTQFGLSGWWIAGGAVCYFVHVAKNFHEMSK